MTTKNKKEHDIKEEVLNKKENAEKEEAETAGEELKEEPTKEEQLAKAEEEIAQLKDKYLRTVAEFDNYKKRTERERAGVAEYARAGIIKKLLPIIDNIERAAGADKESPEYLKGIELIVKQFETLAGNLELTETAKAGDTFDPTLHEAVMHIEDENLGENVIAEVLQKGYKTGDTVVRHAMVKVAN